jgi:hypothetical protein
MADGRRTPKRRRGCAPDMAHGRRRGRAQPIAADPLVIEASIVPLGDGDPRRDRQGRTIVALVRGVPARHPDHPVAAEPDAASCRPSVESESRCDDGSGERWITKQQLAEHLEVTARWIEYRQRVGLPYLRMGGLNRYRVSEVEAWLRDHPADRGGGR